jgi:hypothetical protein
MTTRLTGYATTIPIASDTYILAGIDPQSKPASAKISLVRNGGYDGSVTLQARPAGSSGPFLAWFYTTKAGAISSAAFAAGNDQFSVDVSDLELALVTSGATVGTLSVAVAVANEA